MMNIAVVLLTIANFADHRPMTDISKEAPELKDGFNAAKGSVRLILIVSPG